MSLNLNSYRLNKESLAQIKPKRSTKRKGRRTNRKLSYLGGSIPGDWLSIAGNLPGKTLHVALAIWLAYSVGKSKRFRFTPKWLGWFTMSPATLRRALCRLKDAGLIHVEYRPGCSPIVTVLDAPEETIS